MKYHNPQNLEIPKTLIDKGFRYLSEEEKYLLTLHGGVLLEDDYLWLLEDCYQDYLIEDVIKYKQTSRGFVNEITYITNKKEGYYIKAKLMGNVWSPFYDFALNSIETEKRLELLKMKPNRIYEFGFKKFIEDYFEYLLMRPMCNYEVIYGGCISGFEYASDFESWRVIEAFDWFQFLRKNINDMITHKGITLDVKDFDFGSYIDGERKVAIVITTEFNDYQEKIGIVFD